MVMMVVAYQSLTYNVILSYRPFKDVGKSNFDDQDIYWPLKLVKL